MTSLIRIETGASTTHLNAYNSVFNVENSWTNPSPVARFTQNCFEYTDLSLLFQIKNNNTLY